MKLNCYSSFTLLLLFSFTQCFWALEIPKPTVTFYNDGFEVSIPDEPDIKYDNLMLTLNDYIIDHTTQNTKQNGSWVFQKQDIAIKKGDSFNCWILYCYRNYSVKLSPWYKYIVEHVIYRVPKPTFTIYDNSFEVSIPDESSIEHVTFYGILNEKLNIRKQPQFFAGKHEKLDGLWVYRGQNTEFQKGDTIEYLMYVYVNGTLYERLGKYEVQNIIVTNKNQEKLAVTHGDEEYVRVLTT